MYTVIAPSSLLLGTFRQEERNVPNSEEQGQTALFAG